MSPIKFEECNFTFLKPEDMTDEECGSLEVCRCTDHHGFPVIISCWNLTQEEIDEVQQTGKIWLTVTGESMNPVNLQVERPKFKYE